MSSARERRSGVTVVMAPWCPAPPTVTAGLPRRLLSREPAIDAERVVGKWEYTIRDRVVRVADDAMEGAKLLRRARQQAQLSQVELALRAAVAQPVISAYENGHREPSISTLRKLVDATGQRLVVDVVRGPPLGLPDTPRGRLLRRRRSALHRIADRHGISNLRVFGSVVRGEDGPHSDIDIAADLPEGISLVDLASVAREMSESLGLDVDLVPARLLHPTVAAELEREGIML